MKFIWILILFSGWECAAQTDCALKLEKDSIKIFACILETSKFKTIKATFKLQSRLSQLAALVLDIDYYKEWQYKTVSARVLRKVSEREIIYYTEVAAPILTSNRDFVIRLTIDKDPRTQEMIIDMVSLPDYIPSVKNVVRVPYSKARWRVTPLTPSTIAVEYTIDIDLGGAVPAWLVNIVAPQAPYQTFKALRSKIGNYKGRASFVRDWYSEKYQ